MRLGWQRGWHLGEGAGGQDDGVGGQDERVGGQGEAYIKGLQGVTVYW